MSSLPQSLMTGSQSRDKRKQDPAEVTEPATWTKATLKFTPHLWTFQFQEPRPSVIVKASWTGFPITCKHTSWCQSKAPPGQRTPEAHRKGPCFCQKGHCPVSRDFYLFLSLYFSSSAPWEGREDGPSPWTLVTHMGNPDEAPSFQFQTGPVPDAASTWKVDWQTGRSLSQSLCDFAFQMYIKWLSSICVRYFLVLQDGILAVSRTAPLKGILNFVSCSPSYTAGPVSA